MDNKLPDWEIGKLYNQAWSIIKRHKVLWIFGLATGTTMSFNFNLPFNFDSNNIKDIQQNIQSFPGELASGNLTQVLGTSTSQPIELFSNLLSLVPPFFYAILVVEFIAIVISLIAIGIISKAWSTGALLEGIQVSLSNGVPSIRDSSEKAFSNIRSLAWLQVVPPLVLALGFILILILMLILIIVPITLIKIFLGLLLLIASCAILYGFVYYIFSEIWAARIAVIEKQSGKDSLLRGYKIARKKGNAMILLGIVNIILSGIVIGLPIILVLGFTIGGVFASYLNKTLGIGLIAGGAVLIVPLLIGMTIVGGILNAFKATVWSIAYNNIRGKYDGK